MKKEIVEVLRCRSCQGSYQLDTQGVEFEEIKSGTLVCTGCGEKHPIVNFVPRFVELSNYTDSFAFQRKEHARIQMDKFTGTDNQKRTILERTGWDTGFWKGKTLLECGCGAGPDTQVHLDLGAHVLSVDLSTGVDECRENNYPHANLNIIQADISALPLKSQTFDIVYCHRVIQHTPDPKKTFMEIVKYLRPGGTLFVHSYKRGFKQMFRWKYFLRPITTRMERKSLHRLISFYAPIVQPLYKVINRFKFTRVMAKQFLPYNDKSYEFPNLDNATLIEYGIHDTFDALTPTFDNPIDRKTAISWLEEAGFKEFEVLDRNIILIRAIR